MLSRYGYIQLFVTLWGIACQALLSMGLSRQEYWSGLPCPPPGDLPDPGIQPGSPLAPTLQADSFTTDKLGKPLPAHIPTLSLFFCLAFPSSPGCSTGTQGKRQLVTSEMMHDRFSGLGSLFPFSSSNIAFPYSVLNSSCLIHQTS